MVTFHFNSDVRKTKSDEVSLGGIFEMFAFSASSSYKSMQHTLETTSNYITDTTAFEVMDNSF